MFSLSIVTYFQRNIPWVSWTKKNDDKYLNVIWFLIWRKKLWMKLRLHWVEKTSKLKLWSHKLLYCIIMWVQWTIPSKKKWMNWSSMEDGFASAMKVLNINLKKNQRNFLKKVIWKEWKESENEIPKSVLAELIA